MKVLFAVSTEDIAEKIVKVYQKEYKEIISSKNVYYFNAIIKELQRNQTYDRIVISEDLEPFTNNNYEAIDKFIFEKLDSISDEAIDREGRDIPIVVICSERREKADNLLTKLFSIGVYDALIGNDRTIENVCNLLNKPRTKKEAKTYYRIEQGEYERENDKNVSEMEIQNIIAHYRKLGKNEEKYVESFDSIAEQYNDEQLKIIIKFLPMDVKAVLEAESSKYQSIMTYSTEPIKKEEPVKNDLNVSEITDGHSRQPMGPVIIPSAMRNENEVRKISEPILPQTESEAVGNETNAILEEIENIEGVAPIAPIETIEPVAPVEPITSVVPMETIAPMMPIETVNPLETVSSEENQMQQPVKRGRGRPRKIRTEEELNRPKRGRGRPRKNPIPTTEGQETNAVLPGFEQIEISPIPTMENKEANPMIEGFEENEPTLPGFEEVKPTQLPGFEEETAASLPGTQETAPKMEEPIVNNNDNINYNSSSIRKVKENEEQVDISHLLTQDKKIVAFVGTSKNGVSFLVNNIAEILSNRGINTAIVDLTKNKNSYYVYTENKEELRETAYASMDNLKQGEPIGIEVNRNLTVYTSSPNIRNTSNGIEKILETLVNNYSLVLLDCDYETNKEYFRAVQEIYMVQSMDVLTIQPLTEFLRRLKLNNILQPEKLRAIINKAQKVRGLNEEMIVGGMSTYNDPEMSIQDRLFDMQTITKTVIPFDIDAYATYLSGIANCEISTKGYNKVFKNCLNRLADQVYPVISGGAHKRSKKGNKKGSFDYEQTGTSFSDDMSNALDQMKRQYK